MTLAEQQFTDRQLRQFLLDALNGRHVGSDVCWQILKRWDAKQSGELKRLALDMGEALEHVALTRDGGAT